MQLGAVGGFLIALTIFLTWMFLPNLMEKETVYVPVRPTMSKCDYLFDSYLYRSLEADYAEESNYTNRPLPAEERVSAAYWDLWLEGCFD